jgi:hypothetical protein
MRRALNRLAEAASFRLVAWTGASVDDARREWVDGLAAELAAIDGGWRKLAWAIDGLPLVWSFGKWRERGLESLNRRMQMNSQLPGAQRSTLDSIILNAATLVAWWLMMTIWIRTQFPGGLSDYLTGTITITVACALGALAALSIRRLGAAYVLAGFVAMQVVEFAFHSQYGIRVVQGGPAHFATMTAAIVAVTAATFVERSGMGFARHLVAALASFAAAELGIRAVFGFLWGMTGGGWRFGHFFFDGQTNYAILGCAILGAVLGALIGKWGDRLAIRFPNRKRPAEVAAS